MEGRIHAMPLLQEIMILWCQLFRSSSHCRKAGIAPWCRIFDLGFHIAVECYDFASIFMLSFLYFDDSCRFQDSTMVLLCFILFEEEALMTLTPTFQATNKLAELLACLITSS
jgi:hypothetical protein